MKKRTGTALTVAVGVCAGLALCGPAAQAANIALTAVPTSQTFYVNGQQVQFEAYEIHGNNFVKLRDIGQAVDFGVDYNAATNSVHINSTLPYQEEVIQPVQTTPAPSASITEESVRAALLALKAQYPHFTPYPSPYRSTSNGPYSRGTNCSGWATLCSDAAFGALPWRRVDRPGWDQIRPGDLIEYQNDLGRHVVVVLNRTEDALTYTDSGTNQKVYWDSRVPRQWLEERPGLILYTRYPS